MAMKTNLCYMLSVFYVIVSLTACSNGGNNTAPPSNQLSLTIGEPALVHKGDKVIPDDVSTQIKVSHVVETDERYVTLLSGKAHIQKAM